MKKLPTFLLSFIFVLTFTAVAHANKVFSLKDGSQVHGKLISMDSGVYTVETKSFGTVSVLEEDIVNIGTPGAMQAAQPKGSGFGQMNTGRSYENQINSIQTKMLSDPNLINDVLKLAEDPEIMKILEDPAMMNAAMSYDVEAMKANPGTYKLMSHPKMQALIQKFGVQPPPQP